MTTSFFTTHKFKEWLPCNPNYGEDGIVDLEKELEALLEEEFAEHEFLPGEPVDVEDIILAPPEAPVDAKGKGRGRGRGLGRGGRGRGRAGKGDKGDDGGAIRGRGRGRHGKGGKGAKGGDGGGDGGVDPPAPIVHHPTFRIDIRKDGTICEFKYDTKERYIGCHCKCVKHGKYCRVNRTVTASDRNPSQGRPFDFFLAWSLVSIVWWISEV